MAMKFLPVLLAFAAAPVVSASDFVAPRAPERKIETVAEPVGVTGIVTQIFNVEKPWQAVSPVAPAASGKGVGNVSRDSKAGTPYAATTLTLVGVECW